MLPTTNELTLKPPMKKNLLNVYKEEYVIIMYIVFSTMCIIERKSANSMDVNK